MPALSVHHIHKASCAMQGNCISQPSEEESNLPGKLTFSDWKPGQCVLLVRDIRLMNTFQNICSHKMYVTRKQTRRSDAMEEDVVLWCGTAECNLWMTEVTRQGSGDKDPSLGALVVSGGQAHAQGVCRFLYC